MANSYVHKDHSEVLSIHLLLKDLLALRVVSLLLICNIFKENFLNHWYVLQNYLSVNTEGGKEFKISIMDYEKQSVTMILCNC